MNFIRTFIKQLTSRKKHMSPQITAFFEQNSNTISYIVTDLDTKKCAIIDSVLDFDHASGRTSTTFVDQILAKVKSEGLAVEWILETHVHADHLSAAPYIQEKAGGKIAIGAHITDVQNVFGKVFNAGTEFERDGSQFDKLFQDGDEFAIGSLPARVLHTPGHTPACVTYLIADTGFVGDTLFMPDFGTARTDFPGGSASTLYQSIQKIFSLPDETRLFMCHDYKAPGRDKYAWETTVGEEKAKNIHVGAGADEKSFVTMRETRDAELNMPKLIIPSVQVNMRAGNMPPADDDGVTYLKTPINIL